MLNKNEVKKRSVNIGKQKESQSRQKKNLLHIVLLCTMHMYLVRNSMRKNNDGMMNDRVLCSMLTKNIKKRRIDRVSTVDSK